MRAKLNARLSSLLGLDLSAASGPPAAATAVAAQKDGVEEQEEDNDKQEEEFEFRLFSTSSRSAAPAKVILTTSDDEDAPQGEGGFTVPVRPMSYYVAGDPTPEQWARYRSVAVAGEDILLGARKRAWGLERPWRVIKWTATNKALAALSTGKDTMNPTPSEEHALVAKRKRPGKKRRIAARIKVKAEKEKREADEKFKLSKEEHLKEKKKRLNREKKLKRRAKEKEKKLAAKGDGEGEGGTTQPVSDAGASESDGDNSAA